jgi:hypothetical protein
VSYLWEVIFTVKYVTGLKYKVKVWTVSNETNEASVYCKVIERQEERHRKDEECNKRMGEPTYALMLLKRHQPINHEIIMEDEREVRHARGKGFPLACSED